MGRSRLTLVTYVLFASKNDVTYYAIMTVCDERALLLSPIKGHLYHASHVLWSSPGALQPLGRPRNNPPSFRISSMARILPNI